MVQPGRIYFYLRILLFAIYFLNGIYYIHHNSVTTDEGDHISYGLRVLKGQPGKVYTEDASTLPITALNALPRAIEQALHPGLEKSDGGRSDIKNGRYVSLLICFFAALIVFRWSREIFGEKAGLLSLFFFTFCPNIIGHIPLVGTDAYAMLFVVSSAYFFRRFIIHSGWQNFILFSVSLGLAQISKQSLVLLFPFYGVLSVIILLQRGFFNRFKFNLIRLVVLMAIVCLIINAAFLFQGAGQALNDYTFKSGFFRQIQHVSLINSIPLPFPKPFIDGFDQVNQMLSLGSGHENVSPRSYLMGNYFSGHGLWYYYLVVLSFKVPLIILLLIPLVLFSYFRTKKLTAEFFTMGYPLSIALFFLLMTSLFNSSQHSIRHLLMIFPLIYVCLGQVMHWKTVPLRFVLPLTILYSLTTFYVFFPNLLAYTNELIWNKSKVYKILDGATIDYSQTSERYLKYLKEHPEVKIPTDQPASGEFILNVGRYLDTKNTGHYQWLRNFEPYDHVNYCYLLFRIDSKDLERIKPSP